MGIRSALSTISVSSLIAVVVVILSLTLSEQEKISQQTLSTRLESVASNLANDLFPVLAQNEGDDVAILEVLLRLSPYEGIEIAYVLDQDGRVVSRYRGQALIDGGVEHPFDLATPTVFDASNISITGPRLVAANIIGEPEEPTGYLVVIENISAALDESQGRLLQGMAGPLAVSFLVLVGFTLLVINRFVLPIEKLSQFTLTLAKSKKFNHKARIEGSKEVRELATNFNHLLDRIREQLTQNQEQNQQLIEQRDEMERLANYDNLTQLPNRQFVVRTLNMELARAKREEQDFAVLFFDLDGFKNINDSLGHEIGDRILVMVAERVSMLLREGDLLARLGGDEFLIRLFGCSNMSPLEAFGTRLLEAFEAPMKIDHWQLDIKLSIGIARASDAAYDLKTLLSSADIAMYESKNQGKGRLTLFSATMLAASERKTQITALLSHAIEAGEFSLVYQPRYGKHQEVVSFEALCRWTSEELGSVGPWEFIPVAEQTGSISQITQWVLMQCIQDWPALAEVYGDKLRLSVNISTQDLLTPNFTDSIMTLLGSENVSPEILEFEITETSYLNDVGAAQVFCDSVREKGCKVALDDFGTGYSSLSYLTQIAVDVLKIDQAFVAEINKSSNANLVIKAIIQLAKQLGLETCAEGVEVQYQYQFLRQQGCDEAQGYLLGKPARVEHWLTPTPVQIPH